ncbi:hypothetical protein E1262_11150 [Jiangella aurantiaca]|uniref:Alanine-rich protein n=1 Tax=Jiangella aurantiaca TaxID=2530373 RepID=A0A4R5AF68_9ACTN|nr:hypothetical protein [Jiangella aurantiaca]TDD69829.1 hypothetical protein E1262_11150 [Jiangella aurantiaca]
MEMWAHPISFADDPVREAHRLAAAGISAVRLAFVYHSGRWLLTTSEPGTVVDLPSGAWFRPGQYPARGPVPRRSFAGPQEPAVRAAAALAAAGIETVAWLVGLHSTPLATAHPNLAIRNVFGHRYRHALCPAQPAVRRYAAALAADVATHDVTGLDLEAFGYLGWPHQGAHDKSGPLRPADRWLLSLCTCPACARCLTSAGVGVEELTGRARTAIDAQLADPAPAAADPSADAVTALGADLCDVVHAVRDRVVEELVRDVVAAARDLPVWLRATADRYACAGKTAGDLPALSTVAGHLVLTDLAGDLAALRRDVTQARSLEPGRLAVGWSLLGQHTTDPAMLATLRAEYAGHRLAFYAYDLAPPSRLGWLTNASDERSGQWSRSPG